MEQAIPLESLLQPVESMNKFTTLKAAFIEAFEEIGGVDNLIEWSRCNQTEFYKMLARLMPRKIYADVYAGVSLVECLRETEGRKGKHEEFCLVVAMVVKYFCFYDKASQYIYQEVM
jgi:hypothetical protein